MSTVPGKEPALEQMNDKPAKKFDPQSEILKRYLREISRFPKLTPEEEVLLGQRIQQDDEQALTQMVESNLRFVVSFAKRYRGAGLSFLDLINEGNLGLIEAAKRFDPGREVKFVTYAVWWIRQAIISAIAEKGGSFRLPQKQANMLYKLGKNVSDLALKLQRKPTADEIANQMNLSEKEVRSLMGFSRENISLNTIVDENHDFQLWQRIEQDTIPSAHLQVIKSSLEQHISSILGELGEKEATVIQLRFGLSGGEPQTLKEIGIRLKLSRERIRQIEFKAMEKLRRSQRCQILRGFLN